MREALIDFLILSHCKFVIGTHGSSFSRLAACRGNALFEGITADEQIITTEMMLGGFRYQKTDLDKKKTPIHQKKFPKISPETKIDRIRTLFSIRPAFWSQVSFL